MRVAVTGAAGSLATDVSPALVAKGFELVGIDRVPPPTDWCGREWQTCDLTRDEPDLTGCDAVVHLAGVPLESDWRTLRAANVDSTELVLRVAQQSGVARAVLASSIHAVGFAAVPAQGQLLADDIPARPNTLYGVSKVAMEALGSLYHDRFGMDVVALRIASRFDRPRDARMQHTWLSPADAGRLFVAALTAPSPGFRLVWGISANSEAWLSSAGGTSISYAPQDDAVAFVTPEPGVASRGIGRLVGCSAHRLLPR
ncbi:NAD-dependent epimerase/dehydratase family protein [Branchiibius cervicis]|uniref:NAD-dependent epimerase/dehydratase family protein n=1 Tax=Branchiibius cervicis TaxID=908252 RepID=A0ABW2ATV9_9MICO